MLSENSNDRISNCICMQNCKVAGVLTKVKGIKNSEGYQGDFTINRLTNSKASSELLQLQPNNIFWLKNFLLC